MYLPSESFVSAMLHQSLVLKMTKVGSISFAALICADRRGDDVDLRPATLSGRKQTRVEGCRLVQNSVQILPGVITAQ